MKTIDFVENYAKALETQLWANVEPLIHNNANIIFSNG